MQQEDEKVQWPLQNGETAIWSDSAEISKRSFKWSRDYEPTENVSYERGKGRHKSRCKADAKAPRSEYHLFLREQVSKVTEVDQIKKLS